MRVGSGSANRWVVRDIPAVCNNEHTMLARVAREFFIFPYSHNVPNVIVVVTYPKGEAPALIYGVVNMEGRSKKRKARATDSSANAKSPKEARTTTMMGVVAVGAAGGALVPPVVEDFDIAEMELVVKSPTCFFFC